MSKYYSSFKDNWSVLFHHNTSAPQASASFEASNPIASLVSHSKIALHLANPDLEDVWLEGYEAMQASNEQEAINPYQADSLSHEYWEQGWWASFYGEKPLFGLEAQVPSSYSCSRGPS